jgi:hypothetical protein
MVVASAFVAQRRLGERALGPRKRELDDLAQPGSGTFAGKRPRAVEERGRRRDAGERCCSPITKFEALRPSGVR